MGIIRVPGIADTETEFRQALWYICNRNYLSVDAVATMISHESRFKANAKNPSGSAVGLLQWTKVGAKIAGTTVGELSKLNRLQQLPYVESYYQAMLGKHDRPHDIADYMLLGWGRADLVGADDEFVLASKDSLQTGLAYKNNAALDEAGDGTITVGDLRTSFWRIYDAANDKRTDEHEQGTVRINPLPPNTVMWIDIVKSRQGDFDAWVKANSGNVGIHKVEGLKGGEVTWYLFEVKAPNVWYDGPALPTLAPRGIDTTPEDTVERPPELDPMDLIKQGLETVGKAVVSGATGGIKLLVGAGVVYAGVKWLMRRKGR